MSNTTDERLKRIEQKLNFLTFLFQIQGAIIMRELDDLTAEVNDTDGVIQSAIVLIQGLAAKIAAAGTDPVALKALTDSLNSNKTALASAIAANPL
jgi:hypothetical protein